jgi:TonB family protein
VGNTVEIPKEARVSFAIYMVAIHQRLHPIFAEEMRTARAAYSELRDAGELSTRVEMVLAETDGSIARMGVIRSSGSAVFDTVALVAVRRAAPFGRPHPSIVSPDGMVYIHWEFRNDPYEGCFTRGVLPFLLARPLP